MVIGCAFRSQMVDGDFGVTHVSSLMTSNHYRTESCGMNKFKIRRYNMKHEHKESQNFSKKKRIIIKTIIAVAILTIVSFMIPMISLPLWTIAICILALKFGYYIPIPRHYNADYVERYIKAQEDARLNTKAYLRQAYIHMEEIQRLNDMINKKNNKT